MEIEKTPALPSFAFTKEEEANIDIGMDTQQRAASNFKACMIGKFMGEKQVNGRAMAELFARIWGHHKDLHFIEVGENRFIFCFPDLNYMNKVREGGPWSFDDKMLLMEEYKVGSDVDQHQFQWTEVWVQLLNLPFYLVNEEIGRIVGNSLGQVKGIEAKLDVEESKRMVRVRVRIPFGEKLRRGGFIRLSPTERKWVDFRYERIPAVCNKCGRISHRTYHCSEETEEGEGGEKPYGDWLLQKQTRTNMQTGRGSEDTGGGEGGGQQRRNDSGVWRRGPDPKNPGGSKSIPRFSGRGHFPRPGGVGNFHNQSFSGPTNFMHVNGNGHDLFPKVGGMMGHTTGGNNDNHEGIFQYPFQGNKLKEPASRSFTFEAGKATGPGKKGKNFAAIKHAARNKGKAVSLDLPSKRKTKMGMEEPEEEESLNEEEGRKKTRVGKEKDGEGVVVVDEEIFEEIAEEFVPETQAEAVEQPCQSQ